MKLEQRMSEWFRLAERWNAVMVLAEADILLERKSSADVQRGMMTSSWLTLIHFCIWLSGHQY